MVAGDRCRAGRLVMGPREREGEEGGRGRGGMMVVHLRGLFNSSVQPLPPQPLPAQSAIHHPSRVPTFHHIRTPPPVLATRAERPPSTSPPIASGGGDRGTGVPAKPPPPPPAVIAAVGLTKRYMSWPRPSDTVRRRWFSIATPGPAKAEAAIPVAATSTAR